MINKKYTGVYWHDNDRENGPFALRIGGTSEFVSKINLGDPSCFPPGSIETVNGWGNPNALYFDALDEALEAGEQAWNVDGCHISVETVDESVRV
jgi:hypothetical protein